MPLIIHMNNRGNVKSTWLTVVPVQQDITLWEAEGEESLSPLVPAAGAAPWHVSCQDQSKPGCIYTCGRLLLKVNDDSMSVWVGRSSGVIRVWFTSLPQSGCQSLFIDASWGLIMGFFLPSHCLFWALNRHSFFIHCSLTKTLIAGMHTHSDLGNNNMAGVTIKNSISLAIIIRNSLYHHYHKSVIPPSLCYSNYQKQVKKSNEMKWVKDERLPAVVRD